MHDDDSDQINVTLINFHDLAKMGHDAFISEAEW